MNSQPLCHPSDRRPTSEIKTEFRKMFQAEIADANTASVVSGALGIPMHALTAGGKNLVGRNVTVNQTTPCRRSQPALARYATNGLPFIVQRNGFAIVALK